MKRVADIVKLAYAHDNGYYGQGVTVAVVDSGIMHHEALGRAGSDRFVSAVDMVNGINEFYDDLGHGTHVAGIIGGHTPRFKGMAPECKFVSVKVLDRRGGGKLESVIDGLRWIEANEAVYNIRIVNISVGTPSMRSYDEDSALVRMVDRLWNRGLIVLAAAGNNGPARSSIGAPGISRRIITVGASDDDAGIRGRGMMRYYSGRGPTDSCIKKPDVVAPGSNILSCGNNNRGNNYIYKSGTSMSTPVVSGAVALLLSKYPEMTNREVKIRIKNSTVDLGYPHERQGWGLLDVERLLK